jgi:hypothetical protein
MVETTIIRISKESHKRFIEIQKSRPQDSNNAQTFDYILRVFEESPLRIEISKTLLTSCGGVDNLRIITPTNMGDKLRMDAQDLAIKRAALRAANEVPTKNNTYQESKE